jgi:hypothetical protein
VGRGPWAVSGESEWGYDLRELLPTAD